MAIGGATESRSTPSRDTAPARDSRPAGGANETRETERAPDSGPAERAEGPSTVDRLSVDSSVREAEDDEASRGVIDAAADASAELTGGAEDAPDAVGTGAEAAEAEAEVEAEERAATIEEAISDNFGDFDADGDGHLTEAEIAKALEGDLLPDDRAAMATLRGRQDMFQGASNDEWGFENHGITVADVAAFEASGTQDASIVAEQFGIEQDLAREAPLDPALRDVPADLSEITGTREFYLERYEDFRRRNPDQAAPSYYTDYGLKYFDRFHENKADLAPETQGWINRTGLALQESMEATRVADPAAFAELERNPEAFRAYAYGTHPDAYVGAGLHEVPLMDRLSVLQTPDAGDLFNAEGLWQAGEVGLRVTGQDIAGGAQAVGDGFNYAVHGIEQGVLQMMGVPSGF